MPALTFQTTVGANATNSNIFENKRVSQLPSGGVYDCTYASAGSATGLEEELFVGGVNPLERSMVSIESSADRIVTQDDVVVRFRANGGEKVTVAVHNTTGGGLDHTARLIVTQVG